MYISYKLFLKSKMHGIEESEYFIEQIAISLRPEELTLLNKEFELLIEKKIVLPPIN